MRAVIHRQWQKVTQVAIVLIGLGLLAACQGTPPRDAPALPTSASPAEIPTVSVVPSATSTREQTGADIPKRATSTPMSTATNTATPTVAREVTLAVPAEREALVQAAVEAAADDRWQWRPLGAADPAGALAAGEADVALIRGSDGFPAGQQPLALAVPFTTPWESTDLAQAQAILANGHELVQVLPWRELEPTQKALQVDGLRPGDPAYPLQQSWSLLSAPGYEEAAAALAPLLQQSARPMVHLTAVGDVMLDRLLGAAIAAGRVDYPFANVAARLQQVDVAVANLECALGDMGTPIAKGYTFRAPPAAAQSLARAGIDVVSLANNHALDYGFEALLQGIDLLEQQGIQAVGAGATVSAARAPALLQRGDLTLAFLSYVNVPVEGRPPYFDTESWSASQETPGIAWGHPSEIATDVSAASQQADLVIVLLHSGYEYQEAPSPPQQAAARSAIDAGAALVIGHHAHILQGVEFYGDGVIVYGLGNFAFTIDGPPQTALLDVWLDQNGVHQLSFTPAMVGADGQPRLATSTEASDVFQSIYRLTTLLNSP